MTELMERIQRLEDLEGLKTLTASYANAVNKGWNGKRVDIDRVPMLFTGDVVFESEDMGLQVSGIDAFTASLLKETEIVDFSMHSYTNPLLTIDGDCATGEWLFWIVSRLKNAGSNQVFMSQDLTYFRTREGWRIQRVVLHMGMVLEGKLKR